MGMLTARQTRLQLEYRFHRRAAAPLNVRSLDAADRFANPACGKVIQQAGVGAGHIFTVLGMADAI